MKAMIPSSVEFVISLIMPALLVLIFNPLLNRWPFLLGISTTMIWMPKCLENKSLSRLKKLLFAAGLYAFIFLLISSFCLPDHIGRYQRLYTLIHITCVSVCFLKGILKERYLRD